jgi:hypothetical protein
MDLTTGRNSLPARTPEEISVRLYALARKLDERLDKGELITPEQIRAVAQRIRSYAIRLRASGPPYAEVPQRR